MSRAACIAACLVLTAVRVLTARLLGVNPWAPRLFVFWLDVNVATPDNPVVRTSFNRS